MNCEQALTNAPAARRKSDGAVAVPYSRIREGRQQDRMYIRICTVNGQHCDTDTKGLPGDDWEPLQAKLSWGTAVPIIENIKSELESKKRQNAKLRERIAELEHQLGYPQPGDHGEITHGEIYTRQLTPHEIAERHAEQTEPAKPQPSEASASRACEESPLLEWFDHVQVPKMESAKWLAARAELVRLLEGVE